MNKSEDDFTYEEDDKYHVLKMAASIFIIVFFVVALIISHKKPHDSQQTYVVSGSANEFASFMECVDCSCSKNIDIYDECVKLRVTSNREFDDCKKLLEL